jgi:hypothetical protein
VSIQTPGWKDFDSSDAACLEVGELSLNISGPLLCGVNENCIEIVVIGGVGPFILETTKGVLTQTGERTWNLCAPVNTGSAVPGGAYCLQARFAFFTSFSDCVSACAGCDDALSDCFFIGAASCFNLCAGSCDGLVHFRLTGAGGLSCPGAPEFADACAGLLATGVTCDTRSPGMIEAGCNPCRLSMAGGAVVTVTDANEDQAFGEVETGLSLIEVPDFAIDSFGPESVDVVSEAANTYTPNGVDDYVVAVTITRGYPGRTINSMKVRNDFAEWAMTDNTSTPLGVATSLGGALLNSPSNGSVSLTGSNGQQYFLHGDRHAFPYPPGLFDSTTAKHMTVEINFTDPVYGDFLIHHDFNRP